MMTRTRRAGFAILVLSLGGCLQIGSLEWASETSTLEKPAAGIQRLDIQTRNGAIEVNGRSEVTSVSIEVRKRAGALTKKEAQACLQAIAVDCRVDGEALVLNWDWAETKKPEWQAAVDFVITAPETLEVKAGTGSGSIELTGMNAAAAIESGNGALSIREHRGIASAETANGQIAVVDLTGNLSAKTGNGKIDADCEASRIEVDTRNGAVDVDLSGSAVVDGHISTGNGAVELTLGEDLSARLVCRTGNGRIRLGSEMKADITSKNRANLTAGDGAGRLEVSTGNGSITVQ